MLPVSPLLIIAQGKAGQYDPCLFKTKDKQNKRFSVYKREFEYAIREITCIGEERKRKSIKLKVRGLF
jgi:hypothetical protein